MSFGIALPSWIVEKENSVWVLGLYALVFMVALPTVVGMWWYRSIRYSGDQVIIFCLLSNSLQGKNCDELPEAFFRT